MNCTKAEALIQARLDGELSIDEAIGLGEHFALCAECKALATDLDQVCGAARTLIDLGTAGGDSIAARATAQIAREHTPAAFRRSRWLIWGGLAAAAAILIVLTHLNIFQKTTNGPAHSVAQNTPAPEATESKEAREPAPLPVKSVKEKRFNASSVVSDLYETPQYSEEELNTRELLRKLYVKGEAGAAARQLAAAIDGNETRVLSNLAVAVRDPKVDVEVFKKLSELKPELRLAPVYISALDSARNRKKALQWLRTISNKALSGEPQVWIDWLATARQEPANHDGI
jgi:hypothetical protein